MHILLVESNTTGTGRLFAQTARRLGYTPVLAAEDPGRYPYAGADNIELRRIDTMGFEAVTDLCIELMEAGGLAGITTSSEYFITIAARAAKRLGLPGPDPDAVELCRDKGRQRIRLADAGVPVPEFRIVNEAQEAERAATELGYPVVVKPVSGSGSFLVRLCKDAGQVRNVVDHILGRQHNERGLPLPGRALVERYIPGSEYSVEAFGPDALLGVTAKHVGMPPSFVELGHDFPAALPSPKWQSLQATARASLEAVGLLCGPSHTELRLGDDGPCVMEVNSRLAGGYVPELIRRTWGVNLVEQVIRFALGLPLELASRTGSSGALRFLVTPQQGRLHSVEGISEAASIPGVVDVSLYAVAGQVVHPHGDFRDRLGHVLAVAGGPSGAAAAAAAAQDGVSRLRLQLDEVA